MYSPIKRQTRACSSSLTDFKKRQLPQKRITSGYSSSSRYRQSNPEMQLLRFPNLDKRSANSISLTTDRNTKFKVQMLQEKVEELAADMHNVRLDANHTLKGIRYAHQMLVDKQLANGKKDLMSKIDDLHKLIKITKKSHEDRSNDLREGYISLWNSTEDVKQMVFELRLRTDRLSDTMGYYDTERV